MGMSERPVLAFDFGEKRIGVAIGQTLTNTARPLTQIGCDGDLPQWSEVDKLINNWRPNIILVGLPLNMNDSESPISKKAQHFMRELEQRYKKTVIAVDERLTSHAARERLTDAGRNKPTKKEINSVAAQIILETWLQEQEKNVEIL
jgi:putative Holliday junction resolvase